MLTGAPGAHTRAILPLLILMLACLLPACGGGSSSDTEDNAPRSASDNDPGRQAGEGSTPPVDDTDADDDEPETPRSTHYRRDEIYPKIASQPLQFITSRGGKPLGVYVTLPAHEDGTPASGPFPVILVQSAYNLSISSASASSVLTGAPDPFLVKRGYAIVAADALGTGVSGGGWELLGANEQEAYADVADWIEEQPWFNGKLGLAGLSYMAISGLFTAQQRPDAIDAIFAMVPMGDAMRGTVGTGGMLNPLFMSTWMVLTQVLTTQNIPAVLRYPQHYSTIAASTREHIEQIDAYYLPLIDDALHGAPYVTYDSEFWRTRSPLDRIDQIKAPTMILGGLNDIFQRDPGLLYEGIKRNTDARLVIYDGDHLTSNLFAFSGGNKIPPMMPLLLQWFDHYLMGLDSGVEDIPPVTQYVKNYSPLLGFGYATTTDWPHPEAVPERWYLHGDMSLNQTAPETVEPSRDMTLPPFAELEAGKNSQGNLLVFNVTMNDGTDCSPSYRQWTLGAGGLLKPGCSGDIRELEKDALNYESEPFSEDYYINGPIVADIWLETSAQEAVLSVRVDEVSGRTGKVTQITNGLLLASARAVDEQRSRYLHGELIQPYHYFTQDAVQPVEPGVPFKMNVEIFPTSVLIRKGNRLRISLSPSNQAQGELNYPRQALAKDGITTIHHSPEYPSSILLPVVPVSALN